MNARILLVGLILLLAGALALILLPDGTARVGVTDTEARSENGGLSVLGDVDLASNDRAPDIEVAEEAERAAARRAVDASPTRAKGELEIPTGPVMKGRVVDQRGRGVPNAEVEMRVPLRDQGLIGLLVEDALTRQETTTDGLGYFELIGLPGKGVEFDVGADGYAKLEAFGMDLPTDFTSPIPDLTVAAGVILHGTVVDLGGSALEGAELYVVDPDRPDFGMRMLTNPEPDAVSDAEGRFELPRVKVGKWAVEVRAFERPQRTFRGETLDTGRVLHGLWFEIPPGGSIAGSVKGLDPDRYPEFKVEATPTEGRPFFGGRALERPRGELDSEGRFEIRGLDREVEYEVKIAPADSGLMAFAGMTWTRSETVTIKPLDVEVELQYKPGAELRFQVVDATDTTPIELFTARFGQQANVRTMTTPNGEVRTEHRDGRGAFTDLYESDAVFWSDGEWRLEIDAPGYEAFTRADIKIRDGVDIDLGEIALMPTGRINVVVKDASDGDPINSAIVRLTKLNEDEGEESTSWRGMEMLAAPQKKTKTGSDGRASLDGFGSEPAELVISRTRYADFVQRVVLGAEDLDLEVLLSEEGQITAIALDVNNNELGGVRIEHKAPGDDEVRTRLKASDRGRARFKGLVPGEHQFRIEPRNGEAETAWQTAMVGPGTRADVVLLGPARGRVVGRVTEGGQPLANANVSIGRADGNDEQRWQRSGRRGGRMVSGSSTTTGADGRFTVDDLEYGEYVVRVAHDERAMEETKSVTLDRAEVGVDVALSICGIEGVVVDTSGDPILGAEVVAVAQDGERTEDPWGSWGNFDDPSVVQLEAVGSAPGRRTNATGAFKLRGLQSGAPIKLVVTHPNALRAETEVFVLAPDELRTGMRIVVEPAGSIGLSVKGANTGFYQITATKADGSAVQQAYLWRGNGGSLDALEPGDWKLELKKGTRGDVEPVVLQVREVEVLPGQRLEVEFVDA
ncbi:Alpha-2-macroglobulin MG1 domain protein [Planctomycetes bacterium Pla163]|uniref:Alpha-2-macroglobulin MG1 domain protein n=1 Tax=Rohdeia mirabilis TaxID=2528008 RepID=A0A518CW48_9BACT|nr:Alpha-2-macroglobulin MG1 domain protein [Planctomycetes bacterium Pla163]